MDPFPLQSISNKKLSLDNIIFGRHRDASFQVNSKQFHFKFTFSAPSNYQPTVFFKIKLSDHIVWLSLDSLPSLSYFSKQFEGIDLASLPQEIQSIILESAFAKILNVIEDKLGVVLSIEEYTFTLPDDLAQERLPFAVNINNLAKRIYGCLYLSDPAIEFLVAILEAIPPLRKNYFSSIEIPLAAIIAQEELTFAQFKNLKLRDIILLNDSSFFSNGSCKVIIGDYLVYSGVLKNKKLTLDTLMEKQTNKNSNENDKDYDLEDLHLSDDEEDEYEDEEDHEEHPDDQEELASDEEIEVDFEEAPPSQALPRDLEDIQINLTFEAGRKSLPLKDLQSLKSGFTFELENSADQPITIRANGRAIGTGELLKIGDRIGVRVTSFSKK